MISFAGIDLLQPTPQVCDWVERHIPAPDAQQFAQRVWPGKNLTHQTFPQFQPLNPVRLNTLWWPSGASRWGVGYYLTTGEDASKLRKLCYRTTIDGEETDGLTAQKLILDDESSSDAATRVEALMFMLPPRPLSVPEIAGDFDSLYLITLVDERYFWWWRDCGEITVNDVWSWEDLIVYLAGLGGFDITVDDIEADYLSPDPDSWNKKYEPIPLLLDAACFNAGLRLVRRTTGGIRAMNVDESEILHKYNVGRKFDQRAGGAFEHDDVTAAIPEYVRVTFPKWVDGELTNDFYVVDTRTTIGGGSRKNWWWLYTGFEGKKTFHDAARACFEGNDKTPLNQSSLDLLAKQIALDFYRYQAFQDHDRVYAGINNWRPNGFTDLIEWTYQKGNVYTRVQRQPWNQWPDELVHYDGTCEESGSGDGSGSTSSRCPQVSIRQYDATCVNGEIHKYHQIITQDEDGCLQETDPIFSGVDGCCDCPGDGDGGSGGTGSQGTGSVTIPGGSEGTGSSTLPCTPICCVEELCDTEILTATINFAGCGTNACLVAMNNASWQIKSRRTGRLCSGDATTAPCHGYLYEGIRIFYGDFLSGCWAYASIACHSGPISPTGCWAYRVTFRSSFSTAPVDLNIISCSCAPFLIVAQANFGACTWTLTITE